MEEELIGISIYLLLTFSLLGLVLGPPIAAYYHQDGIAGVLYNTAKPFCHQWIYRSFCLFEVENGNMLIDNCIPNDYENKEIYIKTKYTSASTKYDGKFGYDREQLGRNRAEIVYRDNMIGYKFGMCSRDTALYLGLLIAALGYPFYRKHFPEPPPLRYLISGIIPLGIDGMGQLIGLWESTNTTRFITGIIAGTIIGFYLLLILVHIFKRNQIKTSVEKGDSQRSST